MGYSNHNVAEDDQVVRDWLTTPLGESLLAQEMRVIEEALDGVFGEQCLQVGDWGDARAFLRYSRTQRSALIVERSEPEVSMAAGVAIGEPHRLPVDSDSIDSVILPHTLDFSERPHAVLREVHRVLRASGYLVVLG